MGKPIDARLQCKTIDYNEFSFVLAATAEKKAENSLKINMYLISFQRNGAENGYEKIQPIYSKKKTLFN